MSEDHSAMWYDERVEAYIDGDLPGAEARLFAARLEIDPDLRRSVHEAEQLRNTLGSIPQLTCPDEVVDRVLDATGTRWFTPAIGWAGGLATAAVLALAVNLSGVFQSGPEISDDELAQARHDLGVALAYLDRAGSIAGREVGTQMLKEGIAKPLSHGLKRPQSQSLEDAS